MSYDDVPAQRFPKDVYEWNINASFLRFSATEKFYDVRDIDYTDYTEDIFVGYRHYATAGLPVAYPFGWGLTYTTFDIRPQGWSMRDDGRIVARCRVKNTGRRTARQVVQLYSTKTEGDEPRPAIELRAYAKTPLLQPGESCTVTLAFDRDDLAWFDADRNAWVTEKGRYTLSIGDSSQQLRPIGRPLKIAATTIRKVCEAMLPEGGLFID